MNLEITVSSLLKEFEVVFEGVETLNEDDYDFSERCFKRSYPYIQDLDRFFTLCAHYSRKGEFTTASMARDSNPPVLATSNFLMMMLTDKGWAEKHAKTELEDCKTVVTEPWFERIKLWLDTKPFSEYISNCKVALEKPKWKYCGILASIPYIILKEEGATKVAKIGHYNAQDGTRIDDTFQIDSCKGYETQYGMKYYIYASNQIGKVLIKYTGKEEIETGNIYNIVGNVEHDDKGNTVLKRCRFYKKDEVEQ
jgi:hypothetical protein